MATMMIDTQAIRHLFETQSGYFISKQTGIPQSTINRIQQRSEVNIKLKDGIAMMHLVYELAGKYPVTKYDIKTIGDGIAKVEHVAPGTQDTQIEDVPLDRIVRLSFYYSKIDWEEEHATLLYDMAMEMGKNRFWLTDYLEEEEKNWGESKTFFTKEHLAFKLDVPFVVIQAVAEGDPDNNRRELFVNLDLIVTEDDVVDMINEVIYDVNPQSTSKGLHPEYTVVGFEDRTQPTPFEGATNDIRLTLQHEKDRLVFKQQEHSNRTVKESKEAIKNIEEKYSEAPMPDDAQNKMEFHKQMVEAALEWNKKNEQDIDRLNYRLERLGH